MRTRCCLAASLFAAIVLLVAPAASSGQAPGQDSVIGSGSFESGRTFAFDARSGPSGENPAGTVDFDFFAGTVTCLHVEGNVATIVVATPRFPFPVGLVVTDNAETGMPDTVLSGPTTSPPPPVAPCGGGGTVLFDIVATGDIAVVDAPPFPTSKDQCKDGGWRSFGDTFRNQGQCVAFVQRGPKP